MSLIMTYMSHVSYNDSATAPSVGVLTKISNPSVRGLTPQLQSTAAPQRAANARAFAGLSLSRFPPARSRSRALFLFPSLSVVLSLSLAFSPSLVLFLARARHLLSLCLSLSLSNSRARLSSLYEQLRLLTIYSAYFHDQQ
jgi:hypothetical protein